MEYNVNSDSSALRATKSNRRTDDGQCINSFQTGYGTPGELAGSVNTFMTNDESLPDYWMEIFVERLSQYNKSGRFIGYKYKCPFCIIKYDCTQLRTIVLHIQKEHIKFYDCPVKKDVPVTPQWPTEVDLTEDFDAKVSFKRSRPAQQPIDHFPDHSEFTRLVTSSDFDSRLSNPVPSSSAPRVSFNLEVENTLLLNRLTDLQTRLDNLEAKFK